MSGAAGGPGAAGPVLGAVALALAAAAATALVTGWLIPRLAARGLGKAIRVDGPDHASKSGTPTMGGLAFVAVMVAFGVWLAWRHDSVAPWVVISGVVAFGALGLLDDLAGLAERSGRRELGVGLTARRMFALQAIAALLLVTLWRGLLSEPTVGLAENALRLAWFAFVVVAMVNGVNFTDGLDGLAAGTCALAFGALAVVLAGSLVPDWLSESVVAQGVPLGSMAAVCAGCCLGFLVHNRFPARVMMGNVGSMALGASLALLAVAGGVWWLLPVVGVVFLAEVLSVIAQVSYFKATGGRRVLRMAPLHHHFELGGMSETAVTARLTLVGGLAAAVGIGLAAVVSTWTKG